MPLVKTGDDFSPVLTVFENPRKVAFNIASEASYVYKMSGQKLIKNARKIVKNAKN